MNQPDTKSVPDYNSGLTARPRRRFKFNPLRPPTEANGYYSAFWPLLIVFLSFIMLLLYEVWVLRIRQTMLIQQTTHYANIVQKQKWQGELIEGLHSDLKGLAPTHPAAATMLKDFFPDAPADDQGGSATPAASPTPTP